VKLRYMLDTNQVSYIVNGSSVAARVRLEQLHPNEIACISAVTEGELFYGLAKKPHASRLRTSLEGFLAGIEVLPWDRAEAAVYGLLRARQEVTGKMLEPMDMLIAAHAITSGSILVSRDKAFQQVSFLPGLANWATDLS